MQKKKYRRIPRRKYLVQQHSIWEGVPSFGLVYDENNHTLRVGTNKNGEPLHQLELWICECKLNEWGFVEEVQRSRNVGKLFLFKRFTFNDFCEVRYLSRTNGWIFNDVKRVSDFIH